MKIRSLQINRKKKGFEIKTAKGDFFYPFSKLNPAPISPNGIISAFIDPDLGNEGVTYSLASGKEGSLMLDAFLDYNRDPDYLRKMSVYKLTLKAIKMAQKSKLSKREMARKLQTSPAQIYRLLNPKNTTKSMDELYRFITHLGGEVEFVMKLAA